MKKTKTSWYLAVVIALIAFTVVSFVIPFPKNGVFWVSYLFALLALGLTAALMPRVMAGDTRSKFYGFPIARVLVIYLAVQLGLSLVFMLLATICPVWIPVVIYVLLLCGAALGFLGTETVREEILQQDQVLKGKTTVMREFQSRIGSLTGRCANVETEAAVAHLGEALRFSDPVSSPGLAEIEGNLSAQLDLVVQAVVEGDSNAADLCRMAENILAERNRLCKLGK